MDEFQVYYSGRKKKYISCALPVAVLMSILLLVICITLAVLYSLAIQRTKDSLVEKPGRNYEICNEDQCFDFGQDIVHSMNQSVDPCQDFYAYACGGWQQRNQVKTGKQSSTVIGILRGENYLTLKQALEQVSRNYSQNAAVMKTARFYQSCLNTKTINSAGVRPLIKLVADYGGWSIFSNTDHSVTIETRIARAVRELNVNSLISTTVITDYYDSSSTILTFAPAALTFHRHVYLNKSEQVQNIVKAKIKEFAKQLGIIGMEAKLMAIYNFEVKLAEIESGKTAQEELMESVRKSIREKRAIPNYRIKLNDYCQQPHFSCGFLKRILKMIYGQSFTGEELVYGNTNYFRKLYYLYISTVYAGNSQVLVDYVMWRVVSRYLGAVTLENSSSNDTSPRWTSCIGAMFSTFDMTLGLMYVNSKFDETSKKTVEEMTDDIRQSFINRLPHQTWMDSDTQKQAKEKALAIRIFIGYPSYIKDPKKLEERYKTLSVTDEFFSNFRAANRFYRMRNINMYRKPVDKNAWLEGTSPANVNGFYSPQVNSITYLAGILQSPFYNPAYPSYMQYGAIGMVIGHELAHGFDSSGRLFNKDGNLQNWWSDSADVNFKEKSSCLVNQYNKYKFHGKKVNGTLTINENIADNGGIKIAYDAYQRWAARNKAEKILPGLKLTPDQLFFVGFAQIWCGVFTDKGAAAQLRDVHSPGRYRVIGPLSNFEKFSQAFQCPVNSPMNPRKKCSVW